MKLIDAPIGIFRFDGELVLKTEYCSENKLSGKYIPDCYIVRTGEYFWGGAKTANELNNLDVEPIDFAELLPTVTDTISRQAAIEAIDEIESEIADGLGFEYEKWRKHFCDLSPAQPERIKGRWIESKGQNILLKNLIEKGETWRVCDRCGAGFMIGYQYECDKAYHETFHNFCPKCGADMREVTT